MELDKVLKGELSNPSPKNTPTRRVGLSRKRKSLSDDCKVPCKVNAESLEDSLEISLKPSSATQNYGDSSSSNLTVASERHGEIPEDTANDEVSIQNWEVELQSLKQRISEKEKRIDFLKTEKKANSDRYLEVEKLTELWKNGCKTALFDLLRLYRERQCGNLNLKDLLKQMGIYTIISEQFDGDSELGSLLEEDSE